MDHDMESHVQISWLNIVFTFVALQVAFTVSIIPIFTLLSRVNDGDFSQIYRPHEDTSNLQ